MSRAAGMLAALEVPPPTVREACAGVLRAAAFELTRGRPLPIRLGQALEHLVAELDEMNGKTDGADLELP